MTVSRWIAKSITFLRKRTIMHVWKLNDTYHPKSYQSELAIRNFMSFSEIFLFGIIFMGNRHMNS